jgi:hypothetical protein
MKLLTIGFHEICSPGTFGAATDCLPVRFGA